MERCGAERCGAERGGAERGGAERGGAERAGTERGGVGGGGVEWGAPAHLGVQGAAWSCMLSYCTVGAVAGSQAAVSVSAGEGRVNNVGCTTVRHACRCTTRRYRPPPTQ